MGVVTDHWRDRPAAEQEAVLGGNAARFWRLDEEGDRDHEEHER